MTQPSCHCEARSAEATPNVVTSTYYRNLLFGLPNSFGASRNKLGTPYFTSLKKGADVPTGKTEFQFKAGNLNFHSSGYEWLVVGGPHAKFKGVGTISGSGNYGFTVTATDSDINGGGDADGFRAVKPLRENRTYCMAQSLAGQTAGALACRASNMSTPTGWAVQQAPPSNSARSAQLMAATSIWVCRSQ
jgi:hypothetical protein